MAAGETLSAWGPMAGTPPSTAFATFDVRNEHVVLDFDKDANESVYFSGVLPQNYSGGNLELQIEFMTSTTGGNAVVWAAAFERHHPGVDDFDANNFGSTVTGTAAESTTSGVATVATLAITAAQAGTPEAGESFRIKLTRDASGAFQSGDNCLSDAELVSVELREA